MKFLETFISEPERLNSGFKRIQKKGIPDLFKKEYLEELGFNKPNSILYVSLFKQLGLVDEDEKPVSKYFNEFVKSEEDSKIIIAERVKEAYSRIFLKHDEAHTLSQKEARKLFRKIMGAEKSDTMVYLISDTFFALASYADWEGLAAKKNIKPDKEEGSEITVNEKGELDKAGSAHEEFIRELMKGNQSHDYYREEVSTLAEKRRQELAASSENGNGSNGSLKKSESNGVMKNVNVVAEAEKSTQVKDDTPDQKEEKVRKKKLNKKGKGNTNAKLNIESGYLRNALIKRAELLAEMERPDDAINAYDDIISYTKRDASIQEDDVLAAIYKKASLLEELQKYEDAIHAYNDLIKRHKR